MQALLEVQASGASIMIARGISGTFRKSPLSLNQSQYPFSIYLNLIAIGWGRGQGEGENRALFRPSP